MVGVVKVRHDVCMYVCTSVVRQSFKLNLGISKRKWYQEKVKNVGINMDCKTNTQEENRAMRNSEGS